MRPLRRACIAEVVGTIGTGLFVGSGAALATGGPIGILLAYLIIGSAVYAMMVALGEMTALFPVSGAWVHYATRFVDPALGFAVGWVRSRICDRSDGTRTTGTRMPSLFRQRSPPLRSSSNVRLARSSSASADRQTGTSRPTFVASSFHDCSRSQIAVYISVFICASDLLAMAPL